MDLNKKVYTTKIDDREITLEISRLAQKANASVLGKEGDTVVLATVVMSEDDKPGDFFPLTVDFEERFYAAGKIIGSRFIRREGRPSDEAILSSRLIDRTIRPLFDPRLRREVQVVVTVLSYDEKNDPDEIGLLASSLALHISDIPWNGPVAGVGVEKEGIFKGFFAGTDQKINMIEFEGKEVKEEEIKMVFDEAFLKIKKLVAFQNEIRKEIGKEKQNVILLEPDLTLKTKVKNFIKDELYQSLKEKNIEALKKRLFEYLKNEGFGEYLNIAEVIFEEEVDLFVHKLVLEKEERVDGRKLDEIRDLYGEVGLFKRTHGSALFIRGETQVLAITTLASREAEQIIETMETSGKKRFILHYNFPGFSTGEISKSKGPGRREIGHGNLAAKAINGVLPSEDEFPYTIRVVAETLSSNGSSSMASVCAASMSLMDAGVPIKKQVAGISIGLMSLDGKYKLLTDIQGPEDHYGDMDFKVAGTRNGVNAIQMDVKIDGIDSKIFEEALLRAREARLKILDFMDKIIKEPRPSLSPYAPKIVFIEIPQNKIGDLIGPGGRVINGILQAVNNEVSISIENDGKIYISGYNEELIEKTLSLVKSVTREYKVGEIVEGEVVRILDFGAIVDLGGGQDGMIHISELKDGYVKNIEDIVKVGDKVKAKIIKVENGRISLSLKQL
jgi:polyribonucleotide nucleotidyltransferase